MNKKVIAVLAALGAFSTLTAAAASLGGLTSASLGADTTVVAGCDTDGIALAYTNAYDPTTGAYRTSAVTLSGVNAACSTESYKLTLSDSTSSLTEATGTVTLIGGSQSITLASSVDTKSIVKAALVISG